MSTDILKYLSIIILIVFSFSCNSKSFRETKKGYIPVTKIVDGDTFWVDDGSEKGLKIRLIGINAPETVHPRKEVEHFGKEASDYLSNLLSGKKVRLEYDIDTLDRYGRTLAYVYLKDRTFVNAELLKNGYAQVMTIPPNVKYSKEFLKLERIARQNKIGLWSE